MNLTKKQKYVILAVVALLVGLGGVIGYRMWAASTFDIASGELYTPSGKYMERVFGPDRYSTAAGISKKTFPVATNGTVILASGENWPDAASGASLARKVGGPILLSGSSSLNSNARAEMVRLKASRVIILGGTATLSSSVESSVKSALPNAQVQRISGADRYATAANIALRLYRENGNKINDNTAFVVTGGGFPDVLSAGSVSAAKGYPILYVSSTSLPSATKNALTSMGIKRTLVVGGTAAVSSTVFNQLPGPIRISGADRYATSIQLAEWSRVNLGLKLDNVGIASGENFPDALTAGPYLASMSPAGPIILSPYSVGSVTTNYLSGKKTLLKNIHVFGGSATISSSSYMQLASLVGYGFTSKQITAQELVDGHIKICPILAGTTVDYGDAKGYQAISYYQSGRIVVNPNHTAPLKDIIVHEIYHVLDWRDNGRMDWGESVPRSTPRCY
jgi:putative cell wall-binding protein